MVHDMSIYKNPNQIWIAMDPGPTAKDLEVRLSQFGFVVSCHPGFPGEKGEISVQDRPWIVVADLALKGKMSSLERAGLLWEQCAVPTLFMAGLEDLSKLDPLKNVHAFRIIPYSCPDIELKLNIEFAVHAAQRDREIFKKQEEHKRERAWLQLLLEGSRDGIVLLDNNGRAQDANRTFAQTLGYSMEEVLSLHVWDWDANWPREQLLEMIKNVDESGDRFETLHRRKDGSICDVEVSTSMAMREGRKMVFCVCRDISERKKIQAEKTQALAEVAEARELALVGQVAGKLAHDFNNILGIIMGNVELTLMDCEDIKVRETLELVLEQTQRGQKLTRNLVAFAKDQEPRQRFFSVDRKIEQALTLFKEDFENINLIRDYSQEVPDLFADPGMTEHALVNILQNAIHAVSCSQCPAILVRTSNKDGDIIIEIEDNGCGIPEEFLDRIFEPAFTLKGSRDDIKAYKNGIKGTGYGMANVKKYVVQHQGRINVSSKVQKGTRVEIALPVIERNLTPKEIRQVQTHDFYPGQYILLVEDEPAISDVQYRILTREPCSHQVDVAATGQKAMDLFDRNSYDFVSLDYILPGGINGMDVYHHIRKKNSTIPILFISGNIEFLESIKNLARKDPYMDHLSKPCRNMDYIQCINRLMGASRNEQTD